MWSRARGLQDDCYSPAAAEGAGREIPGSSGGAVRLLPAVNASGGSAE